RYDLLEDIAAAMPEVRDWIAASGFTLEELASIQPGYMAPFASTWHAWDLGKNPLADGRYDVSTDDVATTGTIHDGKMDGRWTRKNHDDKIVGQGTFTAGAGTWKSLYEDGKTMAEGAFAQNRPDGLWRFYHPSGNLAAQGHFENGVRAGAWRF